MTILSVNEQKKKVGKDWQKGLSCLSLYSPNKLYKVVGPIVTGIELIKLPGGKHYRPHFVVYPLWENDIKSSLDIPILSIEFRNKKGFQYSIQYEKHDQIFSEVLAAVLEQTPLPFDSSLTLGQVVAVIDADSETSPLSAAPNSYLQARLKEAKMKIALYLNVSYAESILQEVIMTEWDAEHFKACGFEISVWLKELEKTLANRNDHLKRIQKNRDHQKFGQLPMAELIA